MAARKLVKKPEVSVLEHCISCDVYGKVRCSFISFAPLEAPDSDLVWQPLTSDVTDTSCPREQQHNAKFPVAGISFQSCVNLICRLHLSHCY
jgi:hypothetical protein